MKIDECMQKLKDSTIASLENTPFLAIYTQTLKHIRPHKSLKVTCHQSFIQNSLKMKKVKFASTNE